MFRKLALVVTGLSLTACAAPTPVAPTPKGSPYALSTADQAEIRRGVQAGMKDPDSARFSAMSAARSPSGPLHVCGYVNGKNSFGGYTGDKPFSGVMISDPNLRHFSLVAIGGSDAESRAIISVCRDRGVAM